MALKGAKINKTAMEVFSADDQARLGLVLTAPNHEIALLTQDGNPHEKILAGESLTLINAANAKDFSRLIANVGTLVIPYDLRQVLPLNADTFGVLKNFLAKGGNIVSFYYPIEYLNALVTPNLDQQYMFIDSAVPVAANIATLAMDAPPAKLAKIGNTVGFQFAAMPKTLVSYYGNETAADVFSVPVGAGKYWHVGYTFSDFKPDTATPEQKDWLTVYKAVIKATQKD